MSFSSKVKEELSSQIGSARHCQMAELAAILHFNGKYVAEKGAVILSGDNQAVYEKAQHLSKKLFGVQQDLAVYREKVLSAMKMLDDAGQVAGIGEAVDERLIRNACCKRAYLRGAFLCIGSISNPEKGYHMEFACSGKQQADQLIELIQSFDLEAKQVCRKRYYVVYLKEGEAIVDLLNIMGAYVSLMDLENTRILKEIANSINRRVNCEAANITKTINAATKQCEDIRFLRDVKGLDTLPDSLREMAEIRLAYPDSSLKELGELMDPPVGKSGVNHRLRKLSELADSLRG